LAWGGPGLAWRCQAAAQRYQANSAFPTAGADSRKPQGGSEQRQKNGPRLFIHRPAQAWLAHAPVSMATGGLSVLLVGSPVTTAPHGHTSQHTHTRDHGGRDCPGRSSPWWESSRENPAQQNGGFVSNSETMRPVPGE
jgi:hypothetical protein